MKRVQLGTKRKKASPARKSVAKPSKLRKKATPAKTPAKKSAPARNAKAKTAKAKVAKRKMTRVKAAKTRSAKPKRAVVSKRPPAPPVAAKASLVVPAKAAFSPKAARKTKSPGLAVKTAEPAVTFAIGADEELAVPAAVLSEARPPSRPPARKSARRPALKNDQPAAAPPVTVPAFLLEGDEPSHPEIGGPGEKFSLGPTTSLEHFSEAIAPLPEAYGTGKLFLTARDPHWLYAHWDFTREEQFRHNARSVDRHLVLRVHDAAPTAKPIAEYHVHPESKYWFVHVERAGETYTTELGYYQAGRKWKSLTFSTPQRTPPDNISKDSTVKFATIPAELSFKTMLSLLRETTGDAAQNAPLAHVVDKIRPRAREYFPKSDQPGDWTPEQEQALANVVAADRAGVALPSSEEFVTEKSWPEFTFNFDTGESAPLPPPTSYVSSFFGGEGAKDFWFKVNAELIIYGATEPNATVTFGGKQIQLRPDGSFRFRFALPDGQFELPVTAVSADGTDGRAAELRFARTTEIRGHVAEAPVDPALNPPPAS